jgi:heptosyltransferase-2
MALRLRAMPDRVIVRLPNWLGDTVMAVPALRALRAGWPEARILAAGPWAHTLAGQSLADVLVSYPRAWRGRLATADTVRSFGGQIVILLPSSFEAAVAARYWSAPRRIGFAIGGRSLLLTDRVPVPAPRLHQVDEYLRLVEHLGVAVESRVPTLAPPPADDEARVRARRLLDGVATHTPGPRVGVHLGADYGPSKLWPLARVVEGCRALAAAGMVPVLLGTPRDAAIAEEVVAATAAASLVGRDDPALLTALLSELDALVAGDTGVSHLAAALGTPVVALFGPTDPVLSAPRGTATVLTHPVPCAPCFYRACPIEHPCLNGISAARVVDAVTTALAIRA